MSTDEIRHLRAQVVALEDSLHELYQKWQANLSNKALWTHAYESAKQKCHTSQVQAINKELKSQLMQQQLYLATLQSLIPQSTLYEHVSGIHVLDAIHNPLLLRADISDVERITMLQNRSETALRLAPHLTDKFTRAHVDKVSGFVPFQSTNITADAKYTYVKSIFIVKVPRTTIHQLFHAVVQHFEHLPSEMKRHFDIDYEFQEIHAVSEFHKYVRTRYESRTSFSSVSCTDVSGRLTDTHGVVVVDFVDSDERFPEASEPSRVRREDSAMIYLSPIVDPVTQQTQILLRYVRVNRFNLLPESDVLRDEVHCMEVWNNGDLFMALVCETLKNV
uniref:Uncharacterized protein n=1 Tax=Globisporangium ultimum (strain ATCC 200006 / CBS 805.95 / DAOM BR144) TaxID=431595 RepID=K3X3C8_GLOUD